MNRLLLKGLIEVGGMKFNHIEGGFGEDKKAMLVKDIANIHGREVREINERINNNKKRFKDDVDIIDLLGIGLNDSEIRDFGFTQQAINAYRGLKAKGQCTGIYLLSERGYSKLLKILEDDFAWEQYEKLVDGYFNMRKTTKEMSFEDIMIAQLEEQKKLKNRVITIEQKLDSLEVSPYQRKVIRDLRNKIVIRLLGGKKSSAYRDSSLRGKLYSDISRQYNNYFDIPSYDLTPKNKFDEAIRFLNAYQLPTELWLELNTHINQMSI